jgi:hypothetical protein
MKQFSKVVRELIGCLQKVDNDNYPEVVRELIGWKISSIHSMKLMILA